jgi:hypothetical protein
MMSTVEWIALIGAIVVPVKIFMLLKGQEFWFEKVTKKYWGNATVTTWLSLIAVVVLLILLLQEFNIVQIWAVTVFAMALISLALAPFSKYMLGAEERWFKETNVFRTGWVAGVAWVAVVIWVLVDIILKFV